MYPQHILRPQYLCRDLRRPEYRLFGHLDPKGGNPGGLQEELRREVPSTSLRSFREWISQNFAYSLV